MVEALASRFSVSLLPRGVSVQAQTPQPMQSLAVWGRAVGVRGREVVSTIQIVDKSPARSCFRIVQLTRYDSHVLLQNPTLDVVVAMVLHWLAMVFLLMQQDRACFAPQPWT